MNREVNIWTLLQEASDRVDAWPASKREAAHAWIARNMPEPQHPIPPITDPLGRYWTQPERDAILVDDTHAIMTMASFAQLSDYSRTAPTGCYAGKMWRCCFTDKQWYLRWYSGETFIERNIEYAKIENRLILLVQS